MLGIDHGWSDMAWQMKPRRKSFYWNAPEIIFTVHVMLYAPNTDFLTFHLSTIVRHVKCTFLDCFYTHLQLEMAISVFILVFSHIFCLCMFLIDSRWSDIAWQMTSFPPWGGISLIWSKNHFLQYILLLYPPKTFFQHH